MHRIMENFQELDQNFVDLYWKTRPQGSLLSPRAQGRRTHGYLESENFEYQLIEYQNFEYQNWMNF